MLSLTLSQHHPAYRHDCYLSAKYHSSSLDTRVYCGVHHQSDHELVVSSLHFKIKQSVSDIITLFLVTPSVSTYRTSLAAAYDRHHFTHNNPSPGPTDDANEWSSFKVTILDASDNLPSLPRKEADWITEEVRNMSRKRRKHGYVYETHPPLIVMRKSDKRENRGSYWSTTRCQTPGADGISAELLKLGGYEIIHWLSSLFDSIWGSESISSDWLNHLIVPLHKKGRRSECDSYRGIALLSISRKVLAHILLNRTLRHFCARTSAVSGKVGNTQTNFSPSEC